jgi:hypothetical protein
MFNNVSEKCPIFANMNVNQKFLFLMSSCTTEVLEFIKKAWDRRRGVMYK